MGSKGNFFFGSIPNKPVLYLHFSAIPYYGNIQFFLSFTTSMYNFYLNVPYLRICQSLYFIYHLIIRSTVWLFFSLYEFIIFDDYIVPMKRFGDFFFGSSNTNTSKLSGNGRNNNPDNLCTHTTVNVSNAFGTNPAENYQNFYDCVNVIKDVTGQVFKFLIGQNAGPNTFFKENQKNIDDRFNNFSKEIGQEMSFSNKNLHLGEEGIELEKTKNEK